MKEKEYVEKICNKCKNKNNEIDLCNIYKIINGDYRCPNEDIEEAINEDI